MLRELFKKGQPSYLSARAVKIQEWVSIPAAEHLDILATDIKKLFPEGHDLSLFQQQSSWLMCSSCTTPPSVCLAILSRADDR